MHIALLRQAMSIRKLSPRKGLKFKVFNKKRVGSLALPAQCDILHLFLFSYLLKCFFLAEFLYFSSRMPEQQKSNHPKNKPLHGYFSSLPDVIFTQCR
jgi:hypothetical protein